MAPHGIYPCRDDDTWVAIAVRDDDDWTALGGVIGAPWAAEARFAGLAGRLAEQDELDRLAGRVDRRPGARRGRGRSAVAGRAGRARPAAV